MTNPNIPIRRTGSADNERVQLNKALSGVDETLERSSQWDASFAWGDHRDAGYEVALTETEQFENLGVPSGLAAIQLLDTDPAGSDRIALEVSWNRIGDETIAYDLEIRKSAVGVTTDPLDNADLYSVPIIANDLSVLSIRYTDFFDPDKRYWFRVRIRRDRFVSPWSDFINVETTQNLAVPPLPTNVATQSFLEGVRLTWSYDYTANPNVASIQIRRDGTLIDTVSRPTTVYLDEPLAPNTTFSYTLQAVSFAGIASGQTAPVTGSPTAQKEGTITIRAPSAPSTRPDGSPLQVGDRWLDTSQGDLPHSWTGSLWLREYTIIDGGDIITGSIDANKISVTNLSSINANLGTITAGNITLPSGGFIRSGQSTFDSGTGFFLGNINGIPRFSVGNSAGNKITWNGSAFSVNGRIIDGQSNIVQGTLVADDITTGNLNANLITVGTLNVDRIQNGSLGSVKFASTIQSKEYIPGVKGWAINTGHDPGFDDGGAAEFGNIFARGNIIAGSSSGDRVEITTSNPSGTPRDYRIWIGSGVKNDANGVFWVDVNGNVKIDKTIFGIGAVPIRRTRDDSLVTGLTQNSNGLITTFDQFLSNGQDVLVEANHAFAAFKSTPNPQTCAIPQDTTGTIALQRSFNNGSTWSGNIATATVEYPSTADLFTDPDPSVPDICQQRSAGQASRPLIDSNPPAEGTPIRYRVLFTAWSSFFVSTSSPNQIGTNRFDAALTQ